MIRELIAHEWATMLMGMMMYERKRRKKRGANNMIHMVAFAHTYNASRIVSVGNLPAGWVSLASAANEDLRLISLDAVIIVIMSNGQGLEELQSC